VGYTDKGYEGRRAYIVTTQDQALEAERQERLIRDSGVEWTVKRMDSDHSPFVSHTEELLRVFEELIGGFASKAVVSGSS
jgi:hypothetical protein